MRNALKLLVVVLLFAQCVPAQTVGPEGSAKAVVLQKNEGELRTRRPREIASPGSDFMLKIGIARDNSELSQAIQRTARSSSRRRAGSAMISA